MLDLIVLSGSVATAWGAAPGWGALAFLPSSGEIKKIVDPAFDPATAAGDVLPLAAAIQWYHFARKPKGVHPVVGIATESLELMVSAADPLRGPDGSDWRFMRWFERIGYVINWIHLGARDGDASGVQGALLSYAKECQAALAGRLQKR